MTVLSADQVITQDGVLSPGWVGYEGGVITGVGEGVPERSDRHGHLLVPGFVDAHCHGGGGGSFDSADHEQVRRAAAFHRTHGTTTIVGSLVSATTENLERQAGVLGELVEDGVLAGIHLEGPFLSAARKGAHDERLLRAPDADSLARLVKLPYLAMVTIAPELDGGIDAIRRIAEAGVIAAVGHTDATYDITRAAIEAGARVGTHLFNGMRPLHHREPGPVLALMDDPRVSCELILDGVHLHPAIAGHVARSSAALLVTDAMIAAGMTDGAYELGSLAVEVTSGVARLADSGSIAGSTLTMDHAFRRTARELDATEAVRLASAEPARLLGLADRGAIAPGLRADLVLLDAELAVTYVS